MSWQEIGARIPPDLDHYGRVLSFEEAHARRFGLTRQLRYLENRKYYHGAVEPDNVEQPLDVRYIPRIIEKHVHYLWGQYERDIVNWTVTAEDEELAAKVTRALYTLMRRIDVNDIFLRGSLDGALYGDTVFKLRFDERHGARLDVILPEYYHAIWHPLDIGQTLEAVIAYPLERAVARRLFGQDGNRSYRHTPLDPNLVVVWEWWSEEETMLAIDDTVVVHMMNPYRAKPSSPAWLPLVHIPNLPINGEYYGFGDAEAVHSLQDELNLRLADLGDIVNYHAHPIVLLRNTFKAREEFETGPDKIWDLGREGEAEYLQWSGTPPSVFEYIELVLRVMLDTASLTPVAFGRAEQSQASGSALVVQMLPVIEVARRKRAVWHSRLSLIARRLLELEIMGRTERAFQERWGFGLADLEQVEITPRWAPMLPRDRAQVVNENVTLLANKARSILRALQDLGEDDAAREREQIIADLREFGQLALQLKAQEITQPASDLLNRDGGKNSDRAGERMREDL